MPKKKTRFRFSHRSIDALPIPPQEHPSSNIEYSDEEVTGLRIAVFKKTGRKSFRHRFIFGGKKATRTIGEYPGVNVELARSLVLEDKALIAQDIDPRIERKKKQNAITFAEFATDTFLPFAKDERRSYADIDSRVNGKLIPALGKKKLHLISKTDIAELHLKLRQEISAVTANRTLALVSGMFARAIEWGYVADNPARGIKKFQESGPRHRAMTDDEFGRFIGALKLKMDEQDPQARALFLLLVLGLRKMEVLSARWEHVDLEKGQLYLPTTKSGRPRTAVLNPIAIDLLKTMLSERQNDNPFVFPSRGKCGHLREVRKTHRTIMKEAGIVDLRTHDLRRSFASLLANRGVGIYQIKDLLGHSDVRITQQVYAHLNVQSLQNASEIVSDEAYKVLGSAL